MNNHPKIDDRLKQIEFAGKANGYHSKTITRMQDEYRQAMAGKSLKAAAKAFCLECVMWDKNEVKLCPSVACPLYLYRPFRISKNTSESGFFDPESTNDEKEV